MAGGTTYRDELTRQIGALGLVVALTTCFVAAACSEEQGSDRAASTGSAAKQAATKPEPNQPSMPLVTSLQIEDIVVGKGVEAQTGETVDVHYTGWLYDPKRDGNRGKKFDSSHDRGQPLSFRLGAGRVIRGWDEGVVGMRVGGKRILTIPSGMAYGPRGAGGGSIPPHAELVFEVELMRVR